MNDNFTIEHYRNTIKAYMQCGYMFHDVGFKATLDDTKYFAMVHDVDHNISLCENFLSVEKSLGIGATYFLRLHAKSYNMLSRNSITMAKTILRSGGNIGLHYEPTFCPRGVKYADHISEEINILSTTTGQKIEYFNLHEPARTGVNLAEIMPKVNRCYNSPFFEDYKYLSDSSCRWREGCFSKHVDRWSRLLVLTHPMWWYNKCPAENY